MIDMRARTRLAWHALKGRPLMHRITIRDGGIHIGPRDFDVVLSQTMIFNSRPSPIPPKGLGKWRRWRWERRWLREAQRHWEDTAAVTIRTANAR